MWRACPCPQPIISPPPRYQPALHIDALPEAQARVSHPDLQGTRSDGSPDKRRPQRQDPGHPLRSSGPSHLESVVRQGIPRE